MHPDRKHLLFRHDVRRAALQRADVGKIAAIDDENLGLDRISDLVESIYANMEPGEKMFYERCTVCHGPRDPAGFTRQQWKGILPSMFERAGLDDDERAMVSDFLMKNAADATN